MLNTIDLVKLMLTMRKINNDLASEIRYISTTKDDHTTGRFTKNDLEIIFNGANSLLTILHNSERNYYEYISICETIKARAKFIYHKL